MVLATWFEFKGNYCFTILSYGGLIYYLMFKNEILHDKRGFFNFPIVNFPIICSNISAASACREAFEDAKHCCQRGIQNPYIEEEQTTQWPKEKVQKDKWRSTKHTHKTKDRVTRTPLKTGGELRWSGKVSSSCSTSDTRRVNIVTNTVISHEWGKDLEIYISQLVRYSGACGSYQDILDAANKELATEPRVTLC